MLTWTCLPALVGLMMPLTPPEGTSAPEGVANVPPVVRLSELTGAKFARDDRALLEFEASVRPILAARCAGCHGAKKREAGLRLDLADGIRAGGDSGPVVIPGKPDESPLILAVRRHPDVSAMPPDHPLAERERAALETWVAKGAALPPSAPAGAASNGSTAAHWAFRPVVDRTPPPVRDTAWPRGDLDRFILAELESRGIRPALDADSATWLRRVTYDLTGLPPTPEELATFLADTSGAARERVIDWLLGSIAYAERQARHWLDVARYADSNGLDENLCHGNAWRYRDWVVRSFHADLPYDRFLAEQLAGDLLPGATPEQTRDRKIATGFLSLGPKVLAEVDELKMEMDIIDEQVDTVGKAMLGMTFGCARCHHHKFDPIRTEEYYGLAAIFRRTRTMDSFTKIAKWHEHDLATDADRAAAAAHAKKLADLDESIKRALAAGDKGLSPERGKLPPAEREPHHSKEVAAELARLRDDRKRLAENPPEPTSAMGVIDGKPLEQAVLKRGNHLSPAQVVSRGYPAALDVPAAPRPDGSGSGRLELARWITHPDHPLTARVAVNRLWRWHFGRGLVASVDNFGLLGETPSHPALLDWPARRFIDDGWSLKAIHRRITLSRVYGLASRGDESAASRDPDLKWLSRAPIRRLEAEAVRDGMLAVSGLLDRAVGGSLLTVRNRAFFFDHTSIDGTRYASRRRTLYLPVVRNNLYDVAALLDAPDPASVTGDRSVTTVPTQTLLFLNSDLIIDASAGLAQRLEREAADDRTRLDRLTRLAFSRPARPTDLAAGAEALVSLRKLAADDPSAVSLPTPERERRVWAWLSQAALASNEFVTVP
jgi:hypothetical protein